jgi:hypothetical protein
VLYPGRHEEKGAGTGRHRAVVEEEGHLALDDVEGVVLGLVDVRLELAASLDLDDREGEARRVRGAGEELDVAEPMPLAGRDDDRSTVDSLILRL